MSITNYEDLNKDQLDALREIGNIGSGNAAMALSTMLGRTIDLSVPHVRIMDYEQVSEKLGGPETIMIGLLLTLDNDIKGMIMFLLHQEFSNILAQTLTGGEVGDNGVTDDDTKSAISEIGNIMAASYVNAIAQLLDMNINISTPQLSIDMVGSILSVPAIAFANMSDKIIMIGNEFDHTNSNTTGQVLLMPEVESLQNLITKLGI